MRSNLAERRKYIRLWAPITLSYILPEVDKIYKTVAKNISADGLRFETRDRNIKENDNIEIKLDIPGVDNPVHATVRVIWKRKISLADNAPFDVGVEFLKIEEDNKNTFLKFLCDLLYNLPKENKDAPGKKK